MTLISTATRVFERAPLPDSLSRLAIEAMVGRTGRRLRHAGPGAESRFAAGMTDYPIAEATDLANAQHYELPPDFFSLMLGPQRKYSCCYYEAETSTLADAEESSLTQTAEHADLADGQSILELGCGWGSLSLWMASRFPNATITAVSNSAPQRAFIEAEATRRGLHNLTIVTADMNRYEPNRRFDRVVSVEMFEHMANWRDLLAKVHTWLTPEGSLFVHVFTHNDAPYRFDASDRSDWIAQHFFTSGIMPSHGLIGHFPDLFTVAENWRWSGTHYARTARDWLSRFDSQPDRVNTLLKQVYGKDSALWHRRWRLFLLATEGLFGYDNGSVWGVSHYRLKPT